MKPSKIVNPLIFLRPSKPIPLPKHSERFGLRINYSKTLKRMIIAGRYDVSCELIKAKYFKIRGKGIAEFEATLFHFDGNILPEKAKQRIEKSGFKVAKIEHLLAFGAKYPREQIRYQIICLGSIGNVCDNHFRYMPYLGDDNTIRRLDLHSYCQVLFPHQRFLAVRKKPRQSVS